MKKEYTAEQIEKYFKLFNGALKRDRKYIVNNNNVYDDRNNLILYGNLKPAEKIIEISACR